MNHYSDSNLLDGTLRFLAGKEENERIRYVTVVPQLSDKLNPRFDELATSDVVLFSCTVLHLILKDMWKQQRENYRWRDLQISKASCIR